MHPLKYLSAIVLLHLCTCVPHAPDHFLKTSAPQVITITLAPYNDPFGNLVESVFLQWENAPENADRVLYYTLLKKHSSDSVFDVFNLSQKIPSDIKHFNDPINLDEFPTDGFDSLFYRIYAVDIYGRPGDTSAACTLFIAPQPGKPEFTVKTGCLRWESWIRGGQISYGEFWTSSNKYHWSSKRTDAFPRTDEPAVFTTCKPDSFTVFLGDYLFYVLYIEASEARSIKTGKILVNQ